MTDRGSSRFNFLIKIGDEAKKFGLSYIFFMSNFYPKIWTGGQFQSILIKPLWHFTVYGHGIVLEINSIMKVMTFCSYVIDIVSYMCGITPNFWQLWTYYFHREHFHKALAYLKQAVINIY